MTDPTAPDRPDGPTAQQPSQPPPGEPPHSTRGAIDDTWQSLRGLLGAPTGPETGGLVHGGCSQTFENGAIYFSPASGAHAVRGRIRDKWDELGHESGPFGYPIGPELGNLRDGGCSQKFQDGLILWSPGTDAHAVKGRILDAYARHGWETSPLGYPTEEEFGGLLEGGCAQRFSGGLIYWSPATDAHPVFGAIGQAYADQGWETGIGFPVSDEFGGLREEGCGQHFQTGSIYWSPGTGAYPVKGLIREEYSRQRWQDGPLGYPTSNEQPAGQGVVQYYQRGRITWNMAEGARTNL